MSDETTSEEKARESMNSTGLMAIGAVALFVSYKLGKGVQRLRRQKPDVVQRDPKTYQDGWMDAMQDKKNRS